VKLTRVVLVSVELKLRAGESRRLLGSMDAYSPVFVGSEMAADVRCVHHGADPLDIHNAIGYHGVAAKNYLGPGDVCLNPDTLLTAPAAGTYDCTLGVDAEKPNIVARASGTWLQFDTADVASAGSWTEKTCGSHGDSPTCQYLGDPTDH
jgi:hypothetical protein